MIAALRADVGRDGPDLEEFSCNVGIVLHGELRNAAGTRYINLDATGSGAFIASEEMVIRADGSATFSGNLDAANGTFTGSLVGVSGTFTGALVAATGGFAGELIAATGSFQGALTAASGTFGTITGGKLESAGGQVGVLISGSVPGGWGHYLNLTGSGYLLYSAVSGDRKFSIDYDGNVFLKGELSGATGTFAGNLTAASVGINGHLSWNVSGFGSGFTRGLEWAAGGGVRGYLDGDVGANLTLSGPTLQLQTAGRALGFYGATPIAKPTGVAVSAAGIHAALVGLGLIAG